MKKQWTKPVIEKIDLDTNEFMTSSGEGSHSNNGRWGDGNPHSHNGGEGIGAWHGGKNHDNFPEP